MATDHNEQHEQHQHDHPTPPVAFYRKIYFTLLILLVISVVGPFAGIVWITLITAFGIALVKANLVARNFMALRWEKRLMRWLLVATLALMALFYWGVAPDVMEHSGQNWVNTAAMAAVERGVGGEHAEEAEEHVEEAPAEPRAFSAEEEFNTVCAICHGVAGDGTGPAGAALQPPPADFTSADFWGTRNEQRIFDVIKSGAASVGGSPLMVAFGGRYSDEQIRELVDHVTSFRPN